MPYTDRIAELRQQRGRAVISAQALLDAAETAKRAMMPDEEARFDALMEEGDRLKSQITRMEQADAAERNLAEPQPTQAGGRGAVGDPSPGRQALPEYLARRGAHPMTPVGPEYEETRQALRRFLRAGDRALTSRQQTLLSGTAEQRALQADSDVAGGFLRPDEQFVADLIQAVDDAVFVRRYATVRTVTTAESLGVPVLDADPADADWTSELGTGSEDSTMVFGKRELRPHPLAKRIKVAKKLIRASAIPVEALVRDRLAYKFAITMEKAYLLGTGAGQPLGVFTASADGIPTSRDVATGSATDVTGDGLIDIKYALKAAYWPQARWLFHRDGIKRIRKLKDAVNGQYHWQPGLAGGQPDTILDLPYDVSEYVPNTWTTGLYVGMLANWPYYWIADALDFQIQVLLELYAETHQNGYIGRAESDGMPVLSEAFVRIKTS